MLSRFLQTLRTVSMGTSNSRFTQTLLSRTTTPTNCQLLIPRACLCAVSGKVDSKEINDSPNTNQEERIRRSRLVSVMIGSAVGFIGGCYVLYKKMTKVKAKSEQATVKEGRQIDEVANEQDEGNEEDGKKRKRRSFKARRIIEYENRIRQYSTPDKVFRYFATLKLPVAHHGEESEVFMRPEDFVRSLTPGKIQPEGLGLDEFEKFDQEKHKYKGFNVEEVDEDSSVFGRMGDYGLISFSDYIFLLTVLSLPPRMYEIAFQMFDLNGDGEVSPEEFDKVQNILFSLTATGSRHRDHSNTGSVVSYTVNSGLQVYFFGQNREKKLTGEEFIKFQRTLQKEVMYLEFQSYEPENNKITERQFADMLLTYSSFHDKKKQVILKRVKKAFKDNSKGVTFKQYLNFFHFLRNIGEADVALSFHNAANKAIDPETFKRVASTIAGVTLDDHIVDIVYKMFDENDDGELSHKEFISVMKNQLVRGLENPKDTGFTKLLSAMWNCAKHQTYNVFHPRPAESDH